MRKIISNQNVAPATETKQAFDLSLGTNFGYANGAYLVRLETQPVPTTTEVVAPETREPTAKEIIAKVKARQALQANTDTPVITATPDAPVVPETTTETRVVTFTTKTKGKPGRPKKAQVAAPSVSTVPAPVNSNSPAPTNSGTKAPLPMVRQPVVSTVPVLTPTTHSELDNIVKRGKAADLDLAKPYRSLEELISRVNAVEASLEEFREFGHRRTYVQIAMVHEYLTNAVETNEGLAELIKAGQRRQIDLQLRGRRLLLPGGPLVLGKVRLQRRSG